jgi:glycosyltransferase involved in cell wall biosynthesis/tRNA A37 methylthiotransferase MiaB
MDVPVRHGCKRNTADARLSNDVRGKIAQNGRTGVAMKVLFSNPPWWIENPEAIYTPSLLAGVRAGSRWPFTTAVRSKPGNYVFGDYLPYPFFLGAAATYLARETGASVAFRDSLALREDYASYCNYLREQDFDYVVIESASPSWDHDAQLIASLKAQNPRTKIVVAGPIAALGEKLLSEHPLEAVIQGEYEKGCVKVIGGASGLLPHDLLTEAELNAAPYPYVDSIYAHRYWDGNPKGQRAPQAQVLSSRGCPFKCIFCVWPAVMTNNDPDGRGKRVVRQYTADYMEGLLTELVGRFGYKTIYFDDDTFNLGDRHVRDMCGVMQRIGLPWSAMCRADTISRDTWKLMRESGCFGVKIGFESGNQWVVDNIVRKNLDLEKARDVVLYLKELGFTVHGTFTVGLPGETPEQMEDTRRYRASLPLDTFQESGTAEIEGSPLATLRKTGHLEKYDGASLAGYVGENDGTRKLRLVALQGLTLEQATYCRTNGKPALAEAICRNLLEAGGEDAAVLNLLGQLAAEARKLDLAVRFFSRAVQADPAHFEACVNLGRLLGDQGLAEEAASCYLRALSINADCFEARQGLQQLEATIGRVKAPDRKLLTSLTEALADLPLSVWGQTMRQELWSRDRAVQGASAPARATPVRDYPRLIVLDHGMRFLAGHHFAYNLGLLVECMKRDMRVDFYVYADCQPKAANVLKAKAVLRPTQYSNHSADKYCGYLEDFNIAGTMAEYNLYKCLKGNVDPSDIVFMHTSDPKIVKGLGAWYASLSKELRPHLCLKFQNHCYRYVVKEYKALVQSVFRLALKPFVGMEKVHYAASNKLIASQIKLVAEKPCPVFPIPLQLELPPRSYRSRSEKQSICIGYAGEGRLEQGVGLLPDIIEAILPAYPDAKFVIQLGCRYADDATLWRLRTMGDRVELLENCYIGDDFHKLIRTFDVLLLPYTPKKYIERSSQVVIEAIALGVPLIVPARTSLALEVKQFDCGYALIQNDDAPSVIEAVKEFLDNHDALTRKSVEAAPKCAAFHSGETLVDMLLASCGY